MAWRELIRRRRLAVGLTVGALTAGIAVPVAAQELPVPVTGPDPQLTTDLDAVVSQAPPDTCLRVVVDGVPVYDHRGSDLQVPASTEKLLTSSAVLAGLDPAGVLRTDLLAGGPVRGGVVDGDVVLVGGGDPVLTTSIYRAVRRIPDDRPTTSLDALVDQLASAGITEVRGRVLIDDARYDAQRVVASWPERYLAQDQVGPLGALVVDEGHVLRTGPDELERVRADDPGLGAGEALRALLAARGIRVAEGVGRTTAPAGATVLASVSSPAIRDLVADLLRRSDNRIAEQLLKELGRTAEGQGTTAAGARAVAGWAASAGAAAEGAVVVDGSGLDPGNATSCQALVAALDVAGLDSPLGQSLPVAGRSGTLAKRFGTTAAAGRLHAKTGTLRDVRALAGFVELSDGGTATFSFIANGEVGPSTDRLEAFLAQLLASWRVPCPSSPGPPMEAPAAAASLVLAASAPGGGLAPALPVLATALTTASGELAPLDRCSRTSRIDVDLGTG